MNLQHGTIAVIGLGYVGLPLAVEFGRRRTVLGFDVRGSRIDELRAGRDETLEVPGEDLAASEHLKFSDNPDELKQCSIFIVTVPTPIDQAKRPDLTALRMASETVGKVMPKGAVVIYESTVFPGCTRDVCVPVLERESGMTLNDGFFIGYSPERINPGDKAHRLPDIAKVTSGSTPEAAAQIDDLYAEIITAGTHLAPSIEVAEAAKVIENTQRDLNIALMNELSIIFNQLDIDIQDVLAAARTKWNFMPFTPGLVGGHCIGVDPYYLTHRAQEVGYHPEIILAGRRINDGMGALVADYAAKTMMRRGIPVVGSRILVMGLTFKENCPDLRNSKVIDVINGLQSYNAEIEVWDPWVSIDEAREEFNLDCLTTPPEEGRYDGIVLTVGHREFTELTAEGVRRFGKSDAVLYDVKGIFPREQTDGRL